YILISNYISVIMDGPRYDCAIDAAMSVFEGRWKTVIICLLANNGPMRFNQLLKRIDGVSSRILTKQLRELENDNIVKRDVDTDTSLKVEYSLTPRGETLLPVMRAIAEWGLKNMFPYRVIIDDLT
uniref:winged helix-turn-helix transcriptional regulator n=2 Tax=Candidatus Methanarcanum hacksteinii TaxID=2911857 RepID=UPI0037DDCB38